MLELDYKFFCVYQLPWVTYTVALGLYKSVIVIKEFNKKDYNEVNYTPNPNICIYTGAKCSLYKGI